MKHLLFAIVGLFALVSSAMAQESPHAVLEHWVGDWTGGVAGAAKGTLQHMAATPDHADVKWTLDNKFVQGVNLDAEGKPVGIWMMRYDGGSDSYQVIFFLSSGTVSVWTGEWDEATLTMSWDALDNDSGIVGAGTTTFSDGTQTWTLTYPSEGEEINQSGTLTKQ